jgi:hypothetical protein
MIENVGGHMFLSVHRWKRNIFENHKKASKKTFLELIENTFLQSTNEKAFSLIIEI